MNIIIGGAWPYANGSLHIGHLAGLLPGDVLARYFRAKGDSVYYVSGSDCYGTPVALRARREGTTPRALSDRYHEEFTAVFRRLGFSYDHYGKTSDPEHIAFVQDFHRRLYRSGYVHEQTAPQAVCPHCGRAVPDRYVAGTCPQCGGPARGDQCDACGAVLEAEGLVEPRCAECGGPVSFEPTAQLVFALTRLKGALRAYAAGRPGWRRNAAAVTSRYLDEGLRDRAITRNLDWGIPVPDGVNDEAADDQPGRKIYIWAENVLGYLSGTAAVARERGLSLREVWNSADSFHYYVHGKDNIPFHTIILPALLLTEREWAHLPDEIVSSEYLTLEGEKISTSRGWAIWVKDIAWRYQPDALRYFFLANGPEKRDVDFSWREFVEQNNSELLGGYGNFIHRTLSFLLRYGGGRVPGGAFDPEIRQEIEAAFPAVGRLIEKARLRDALGAIFMLVRRGNRYFDGQQPWKTREEAPERCADALFTCVQLAANLSVLFRPFLPFSSESVAGWLGLSAEWRTQEVPAGFLLPETVAPLFGRLDKAVAEEGTARLAACEKATKTAVSAVDNFS